MKGRLYKILLLAIILFMMLLFFELILRRMYSDTIYVPSRVIQQVQSLLKLHPRMGYLWEEDIASDKNIIIKWNDVVEPSVSTDHTGFWNSPEAIQERKKGRHIDIIGLGDSFIHNAASIFYQHFRSNNMFYYNMAMSRHCPPQYNLILDEYAKTEKPNYIIYGLHMTDFFETKDFEDWKESGMDWFTYHSGTWCGPSLNKDRITRFFIKNLKGSYAFYRLIVAKLKANGPIRKNSQNDEGRAAVGPDKISSYIIEAYELAKRNNITFILVIIPTKRTTFIDFPHHPDIYDETIFLLKDTTIPILDLRKSFSKAKEPKTLFYVQDGHWNEKGISLAADTLIDYITEMNSVGVTPKSP